MDGAVEHEADHGEGDHCLGHLGQVFVVPGQAPPPAEPAECSFHHPAARQHGPGQPITSIEPTFSNGVIAILGQMPAQGVDALRALAHQQIPSTEHSFVCLLLLAPHWNKAHARPLSRFADGLGIHRVVLLPLYNGLT